MEDYLKFAIAAGITLPGIALAWRIVTNDEMAWTALGAFCVCAILGAAYANLKQMQSVLHLRSENNLQDRFLTQAAESQMRVAQAGAGGHSLGSGWEAEIESDVYGSLRRGRERLPAGEVIEGVAQEVS